MALSYPGDTIEHMFGSSRLRELGDDALISALTDATRAEAVAAARRLALVAEVTSRHCEDEDESSALKLIDGWAMAKAQISAACNLGPHAANTQMRVGAALRDRLPRTAALFATGAISAKVITAITWRTHLVADEDALVDIDAGISGSATEFGLLSERGLIAAVDYWVHRFDPVAVLRSEAAAKDRYVEFGDGADPDGVVSFWGRMRATDAKISEERLNQLADGVCANDPRTKRARRADAIAAVLAGADRLTCLCGDPDCAGSGRDPRAGAVNVYVLPEQTPGATYGAQPGPGPEPTAPIDPEPDSGPGRKRPHEEPAATGDPKPDRKPVVEPPASPAASAPAARSIPPGAGAGITLDGTIIPAHLLAELIRTGATVRRMSSPADLGVEPRYRPSAKLSAFVRMSSMACAFPGCGRPAHKADLDHVTPWPAGATHPGNLRPYCREHHLVKTLHTGWTPTAHSDGSTTWVAPTGHAYAVAPLAAVLFPHNNIHTEVPRARHISLIDDGNLEPVLPARQRTRKRDREYRVNAERTRNALEIALERARGQTRPAFRTSGPTAGYFDRSAAGHADDDPPPF